MAVKTLYLSSTDITAGVLDTLTETAPSSLVATTGWTVGQNTSNFSVYYPNTLRVRTTFAAPEPTAFSARGFRTAAITGTFASGAWSLAFQVRSGATYFAQTGQVRLRIWKGSNAAGTGATQVTSGWIASTTVSFTAANQDKTGTITTPSLGALQFSAEYLFLELEWATVASGGNNAAAVYFVINGGAAHKLTTTEFTPPITGDLSATEPGSDTAACSGTVENIVWAYWTEKPPLGVPLREDGHWSVEGLTHAIIFDSLGGLDHVSSTRGTLYNGATVSLDDGEYSLYCANESNEAFSGIPATGLGRYTGTVLIRFHPPYDSNTTALNAKLIDNSAGSRIVMYPNPVRGFDVYNDGRYAVYGSIWTATQRVTLALVYDKVSDRQDVYIAGIKKTPTLREGTWGTSEVSGDLIVGNRESYNYQGAGCPIYSVFYYDRILSDDEIEQISSNPWLIFEPLSYMAALETVDTATVSGEISGSQNTTGDVATTEPTDAFAGNGALTTTGTLGVTEATDVLSSGGQVGLSGTLTGAEPSDTFAGSGALTTTGTLGVTEATETFAASGALTSTGTFDAPEAADVLNSGGQVGLSGTLSISESIDAFEANGSLTSAGTLSTTETTDGFDSEGNAGLAASLNVVEPFDSFPVSGDLRVNGDFATNEAIDSIAASAVQDSTIGLSAIETLDTVAFLGETLTVATAATTEQIDIASISGVSVVAGFSASVDQTDNASVSGSIATVGSAAMIDPADTAALLCVISTVGSLGSNEGTDTISAMGIISYDGYLSLVEQSDSAVITCAAFNVGSLASIESRDTALVVSGQDSIALTMDTAETIDSSSFSVDLKVPGSMAVTDSPDVPQSTAQTMTVGAILAQESTSTLSAQGTTGLRGDLFPIEPQDTFQSLADLHLFVEFSTTENLDIAVLLGPDQDVIECVGHFHEASDSINLVGSISVTGYISLQEPIDRIIRYQTYSGGFTAVIVGPGFVGHERKRMFVANERNTMFVGSEVDLFLRPNFRLLVDGETGSQLIDGDTGAAIIG